VTFWEANRKSCERDFRRILPLFAGEWSTALKNLIELQLEDGGRVLVEVDNAGANTPVLRGLDSKQLSEKVVQTFEEALANLRPAVEAIVVRFKDLNVAPEELGVEFGIKFSADAKAYIASVSAEANFKVTLNWKLK